VPSSMDDQDCAGATDRQAAAPPYEMRGYETRDANTRGVLGFLAVLFVVLILVLFGTWRLFRFYAVADRSAAPASYFANERQIPASPDLEVNGPEDFQNIYAKQQQELDTYAWQDRKARIVRIPIERAMDLLLEKGLPVMPSGTEGQSTVGNLAPKSRKNSADAPNAALHEGSGGDGQ
jgi:hypothetical protein